MGKDQTPLGSINGVVDEETFSSISTWNQSNHSNNLDSGNINKEESGNIVGVEESMEEMSDKLGKGSSIRKEAETSRLEIKRFLGNLPEPASFLGSSTRLESSQRINLGILHFNQLREWQVQL